MTTKRIGLMAIGLFVGVSLVGAVAFAQSQTATVPGPTTVATLQTTPVEVPQRQLGPNPQATAQPTTSPAEIVALGSVEANQVVSLQFQTAGTVKGIYAQVGDYVQAGDVLADLDASDAWDSYQQAQLNLKSANIAMIQLKEQPTAQPRTP